MINLQKGQRIEISLKKVCVGLGWDPNTGNGDDFDLDASAFMLNAAHKLQKDEFFVLTTLYRQTDPLNHPAMTLPAATVTMVMTKS